MAREFAHSVGLGLLSSIYVFIFYQWWLMAGSRLLLLLLLAFSLFFGAVLVYWRQFPVREEFQKSIIVFSIIIGLFTGGLTALANLPPFGMSNSVEQTLISPDGRYEAITFYRDGIAFGYYFVAIKPRSFAILNILDYPYTEVTEFDAEGLSDVSWSSNNTLVVGYYSGASFAQQDRSWRDVKIIYKDQGKSPKE